MVLQPNFSLEFYPLVLGIPWIDTSNAYIGCRSGKMIITQGNPTKNLILYPPINPSNDHHTPLWVGVKDNDEENASQIATLDRLVLYKGETKDGMINNLIIDVSSFQLQAFTFFNYILD